jgi:N-acetylated-alpha-linked acidic dipeptidase
MTLHRGSRVAIAFAVAAILAPASRPSAQSAPAAAEPGDRWETAFRVLPVPANIRAYDERMSARPHHVGSPYDKDNAEWMLARFKEWGWDAKIERFDVLFPTPKERLLEMVTPTRFVARLEEPAVPVDPTSGQKSEQLPTYNAYSADGDVTAPLVYVNYGRPEDYEQLERLGVPVKGAIVIARYGASWRGIKPKVAAEHGAVGCLIYSDPRDDGYFGGDVFPEGPMRARDGVQRGSVMDMPVYPGDPLTPGVGATPEAKRLAIKDVTTITKIPVLPISYGDAQPLLAAMKGALAPAAWRGALPITYRIGPGPATVHLKLAFNWDIKPLYDVIARLAGATYPDEWIIRGNHHDAWVNGAGDPVSGMSAELEEARALGELRKQGWQPKRTIVYAAWDGEEPALLGSTEWVETHGAELEAHAVVYINTDSNGRGYLDMAGSHTLEPFINGVAKSVDDPEAKVSVWKRLQAARVANGTPEERSEARTRGDLRIDALGSGSDFTPFLQHSGVPTLSLGYGGEDDSGIYHSIYDDFYVYTHFEDTDFAYGRLAAQTVGTAVIRLADAEILPFDFTRLAETAKNYVEDVQALLKRRQDEVRERNRQIEDGVFAATNDPRRPLVAPALEPAPPALNFAPLENAAAALTAAAGRYQKALASASPRLSGHAAAIRAVNAKLTQSERQLLDPAGLPHREWYRHLLYAPGFYTGYDVKTLPGVREGIEQRQYKEAEAEIVRAARALEREASLVEAAAAELERIAPQQPSAQGIDELLLRPDAPEMNRRAPERFRVRMVTSKGTIVIEVVRAWAPRGTDRFFNLVAHGYYDDGRFFRVTEGKWAQFGIHAEPRVSTLWRTTTIPDDPAGESNVRGTVAFAFAVPNGRTTQVFINLRDNSSTHDKEPFVPFGRVVEGMDVAAVLNPEYGESAGGGIRAGKQDPLFTGGNAYLTREFPRLDYIRKASIER